MQKFDFNTIQNFDKHINQSIPNYDVLFESILRISEYFIIPNKTIYDIGCSTGKLLLTLSKDFPQNKMVGIDNSTNLIPKEIDNPIFIVSDLNNGYIFSNAYIIYSIFTIQFLRKERRQNLIQNIYDGLCKGGAFIFAEKTYVENAMLQDIFTFSYYDYKKNSFSEKEILDKEKDLRKILKPNFEVDNIEMLKKSGFDIVSIFYKYFMFTCYLCIKK